MELSREQHESRFERAADAIENRAERAGDQIWLAAKHRPILTVAIVATGGIVLSTLIGVAELAVGVGSGTSRTSCSARASRRRRRSATR
jgi:hypothetical protein